MVFESFLNLYLLFVCYVSAAGCYHFDSDNYSLGKLRRARQVYVTD